MCCKPCSRSRWRWRLQRLLVRLFVVAVGYFVFSTRRRRLLAMPVRRWIRDEAQQLVVAGPRCRWRGRLPKLLMWLFIVGSFMYTTRRGDCWHCPPAARCVKDSTAWSCKPCSCCHWRWRLKRLLVQLFVVAVVCSVLSTRRRRLLELPVRHSIRDEARQLVAADDALAVDDGSVCRGYSMARHRRRWRLYVHDSSAAIAGVANPPQIAC